MTEECAYGHLSRLELEQRLYELEVASTGVFVAIWTQIQRGTITERGLVAHTTSVLRDTINPNLIENPNWLPEELNN